MDRSEPDLDLAAFMTYSDWILIQLYKSNRMQFHPFFNHFVPLVHRTNM